MTTGLRTFHGTRTAASGDVETFVATATAPELRQQTGDYVTILTLTALEDEPREIIGETEGETAIMAEMGIQILWATHGIAVVSVNGEDTAETDH